MEIAVSETDSDYFDIHLPDLGQRRYIELADPLEPLASRDYFASVMRVLRKRDCLPKTGAEIRISSNIPINAGASSSSALTIGWATALLELAEKRSSMNSQEVGLIGYEAEVLEHNEPGGMMDQISIAGSGVMYIDTESYSVTQLRDALPGLMLAESLEPKQTLEVLKNIREPVWQAFHALAAAYPMKSLKELTLSQIDTFSESKPLKNAALLKAAVRNFQITCKARPLLQQAVLDIEQIGSLMYTQHRILADDLKLSTPKIESMISAALEAGAFGAKINGSGGGGTIVILAPVNKQETIRVAVETVGGSAYPVEVDQGARVVYG